MRQITALMVLLLLVAPCVFAKDDTSDEKAGAEKAASTVTVAPKLEAGEEVIKFDAEEIFAIVEQVLSDPKADRVAAKAFLQKALDGQVVLTRLEVPVNEGSTTCEAKKCRGKLCRKCDLKTGKCFCNSCCLAAAP